MIIEKKIPWRLLTFYLLALYLFKFLTPFDFYAPNTRFGNLDLSIETTVSIAQKGNIKRQVTFLSVAFMALLILFKTKNRFQMNGLLSWTIVLYLLLILFSLTWSLNIQYTMKRVVIYFIIWFSALVMASRSSIREVASFTVFITGASLALGIGNELRLGTMEPLNQAWRFSGIFHPVGMGLNCSFLALSSLFMSTTEKKKNYRLFFTILTITAIVFMIFTRTRSVTLASIAAMGYYLFRMATNRRMMLSILAIIIFCLAGYVTFGERFLDYGKSATTLGRGETAQESVGTLTGRIPLWKYSFNYALERPFRGYGFSTFIYPERKYEIYRELGWTPNTLHSGFMNALLGTGFIGLAALILIFILALTRSFLLSKSDTTYHFVFSVFLWLLILTTVESGVLLRASVMTFTCITLFCRIAFLPAEEWK